MTDQVLTVPAPPQQLVVPGSNTTGLVQTAQPAQQLVNPGGVQGIPGPPGPQGPPGTADLNYTFTQNTPASTWTINHGLNKYPSVTVVDSGGSECEGTLLYDSLTSLRVVFSAAFSGQAFLN